MTFAAADDGLRYTHFCVLTLGNNTQISEGRIAIQYKLETVGNTCKILLNPALSVVSLRPACRTFAVADEWLTGHGVLVAIL